MTRCFSALYFLKCCSKSGCMSVPVPFLSPCNSVMIFIHADFLLCSFFPYFTPKLFCFLCIRLLGCLCILHWLVGGIFFPYLLFLYSLILFQYLSGLPPFASFSNLFLQLVLSDLFAVLLRSFHPNITQCVSFLSSFACCRFFIFLSSRIFHLNFVFSQTSFSPAEIT